VLSFNAGVFCHAKLTLTDDRCSIEFSNDPDGVSAPGEKGAIFRMPSYTLFHKHD
jgi:hypothetical protein